MDNTVISKIESRLEHSKVWKISNQAGHYLEVVFKYDLENEIRNIRNFSFNRFESEQLNALLSTVDSLEQNYRLELSQENIGSGYLPLSADKARSCFTAI
ncbi:hypothetical protein [Ligilactobacillus equi]|nr:hypothetical protein [Ligilactobacillus equi]MCQ2557088.1 hypothetical protein [Ligilactobacillus sp.]